MVFLLIIPVLALSIWIVRATYGRLRRMHATSAWWGAFGFFAVVGFVAGCWLTFWFQYQVSDRMRFAGFPIPLEFIHLENDGWISFVSPAPLQLFGMIANVSVAVAVAFLPMLVASSIIGRRRGTV